jgi:hypothetical protein
MHCHAQTSDWVSNSGDFGGKFTFLDVQEFDYVADSGDPHSRNDQQERFRQMNQLVELVDGPGVYKDFVDSLYGGTGPTQTRAARNQAKMAGDLATVS